MESTFGAAVINLAAALDRVSGDRELLGEVAGLFLENSPGLMVKIQEAVAARDARQLERAAHALKGSAANFAADPTVEAALRLEQMGRQGELDGLAEAYHALHQEMERLAPALAELAAGSRQ